MILSNVPAASLPAERMEVLRRYVGDFGGGLIAVGGDQSFTPGGYRGTPLEEILPVRSEAKKNKPKPTLAMVLVLDCSGSMEGKSISLAKQAARPGGGNARPARPGGRAGLRGRELVGQPAARLHRQGADPPPHRHHRRRRRDRHVSGAGQGLPGPAGSRSPT